MTDQNPKKHLTPEQRNHQNALARAKRLNMKLTRIKLLAAELDKAVASGKTSVSTKQVAKWSQQIKDILNIKEESQ